MSANVTLPMLVGSLALLWAVPAHAQDVANSFQQLSGVIKPGDTIYVTDRGGVTIKGTLAELSASTLRIRVGRDRSAQAHSLPEGTVNNIVVERADPLWNGPLVGFAVGAASGLLIELAGRGQYEKFSGRTAIGLGSIGLLTGLLIDVANKEKATVYVHGSAQQPRAARVFPRVSKSAVSVQIAVGF
jgi:hypothetical protein